MGVSTGVDFSSVAAAVVAVEFAASAVVVGVGVATGAATGDGVGVTVGCCELPEISKSLALFCKQTRRRDHIEK